ncbi:sensor histidine kinase [Microvirga roseola]|uniref:sensor histidine kinase n=1 Tax=Microvirga roseola TaxID=2883126 RepID=UPI001E538570|nr:HWE histidine kinase domain-containing protein [Microvirga roseola]
MTLTRRLLLLALISVLPAIVIWTYTEVSLRRAREAEVNELAIRQARLVGGELERIFDGVHSLLLAIDEVPSIRNFDTPTCSPYLKAIQEKVPYVLSFVAMDLSGHIRCRPTGTIDTSYYFTDRVYFHNALNQRGFAIGEYTAEFTEGGLGPYPVLPLAIPIWNDRGDIVGVVAAALDLKWLNQKIKERTLPAEGSVTITDRNGIILAREPYSERFVGKLLAPPLMPHAWADTPGAYETVSLDGVKRVLGYLPFDAPPKNIYISAGLSTKAAFATINEAAKRGFMLIAAALVLALSLSWLASRAFVTRPFEIMTDAVRSWRRGNYESRIVLPGSSGEFNLLAKAFNDLMDDVAERQKALQASEERARLALEAGHMGTWWYDIEKQTGGWSPQAALLLGLPASKTDTSVPEWKDIVHPDYLEQVLEHLRAAVRGNGNYEDEFRILHPSGHSRWINSKGRVFFDHHGNPTYFIGIFQDITERRYAEEQQRFLLDELNHRVKNTLATVQSIASQTLRNAATADQFKAAFEGRLLALSKTHDLLTRKSWREADLRDLAEQELAPYRRATDERVAISGPDVHLPARYVINLGLVLHELVTNAAKYGALSTPNGHLELTWAIDEAEPTPQVRILWQETGGPPVSPPKRQGFGSRLIRRGIEGELAGCIKIDFTPAGVSYDFTVPLPCESGLSQQQ